MSAARRDASSLFASAREDGPGADEREAVFRKVALATGIATSTVAVVTTMTPAVAFKVASGAPGAIASVPPVAAAFSTKALAVGALLGSLGTALVVLAAIALREPDPALRVAETALGSGEVHAARGLAVARAAQRGEARALLNEPESAPPSRAPAPAPPASSDLAEEARLVTAGRSALVAGDPTRALALVQATRTLGARALEPEELSLEARALRALGRADDAAATEHVLRRRYPGSALAR